MKTATQAPAKLDVPFDVFQVITCLWDKARDNLDRIELEYLTNSDDFADVMLLQICQRTDTLAGLWSEAHSKFGKTGFEDRTHSILWDLVNSMWLVQAFHEVGKSARDRLTT